MKCFKVMIFKSLIASGLILAAPTLAAAQDAMPDIKKDEVSVAESITVNVWTEGSMPGRGAAEPEAPLPPRGDGFTRMTNVSRPTLTVFPAAKKNSPAVIVCPGGGYGYVVVDKEGSEVAKWLNSYGFTALVLKYRVPDNREGALQDIQRAVSLARERARNWNIDPKRLGVLGFSAGGNLAAKASTQFDARSYASIDKID